jgi:hypothetical protein
MDQLALNVAKWLWARSTVLAANPVIVTIAKQQYAGARYVEECDDGVVLECLYLVCELPPLFRHRRVCFRTSDSEERDWHVTAWYRRIADSTEYDQVHPFGSHLILDHYTELNSWAIAQCDPKLRRLKMVIEEVGPHLSSRLESEENHD